MRLQAARNFSPFDTHTPWPMPTGARHLYHSFLHSSGLSSSLYQKSNVVLDYFNFVRAGVQNLSNNMN